LIDITPEGATHRECWIWFAEEPFRPAGYDIVSFKEARLEVSNDLFSPKPFDTLWSDLTLSEEELWAKLHRGKKRDVAIARKSKWPISCGNDATAIQRFHIAHTAFTASKQIGPSVTLETLRRNAEHCLAAFVHDREGKLICWNFYVLDKSITRLWYAGSDLTYPKSSDRGNAAALLHWEMILYFRKEGFETYDWGGVVLNSTDPRYSITQFKLSFGGTPQRLFDYSYRFPLSRSRRLWRRLLRGLRKTHQRLL